MREILFRGKRIYNGEWIEGYLFDDGIAGSKRVFIGGLVITDYIGPACDRYQVGINFYEVDPSTVGQYTGLTDKNGKRIFEGDIVKIVGDSAECIENTIFAVQYEKSGDSACGYGLFDCFEYEIIGNVHDNPELLEATK